MSVTPHDHFPETEFISSCRGCKAETNNWRCRIGWHKWLYLFQTAPWTAYRWCRRCRKYQESYADGFTVLSVSWRWVSSACVDKAFGYWKGVRA